MIYLPAANNGSADPTLNNRANALAQAINKTGVQAMANPCTYVAWTAAAATVGTGGVAVAHAGEITAAAAENAPTNTSRILQWWFNLTGGLPQLSVMQHLGVPHPFALFAKGWARKSSRCRSSHL